VGKCRFVAYISQTEVDVSRKIGELISASSGGNEEAQGWASPILCTRDLVT